MNTFKQSPVSAFVLALCALSLCALSSRVLAQTNAPKTAADPLDRPFVTVNDAAQPTAWAELVFRDLRARGAPDNEQTRQEVRELLINQAVLADEARRLSLDKEPLVRHQMELTRREALVRAWQQRQLAGFKPSDDEIKAEFEAQLAKLGDKEYLVRHLQVTEAATAKLLLEKIASGTPLEALVAEYSEDASTKSKGGLADWALANNLLPPILEAVQGLAKGTVVKQAIKSNLGWHLVQLVDVRAVKPPTLDEAKPRVVAILAQKMLEARTKELRAKARVK